MYLERQISLAQRRMLVQPNLTRPPGLFFGCGRVPVWVKGPERGRHDAARPMEIRSAVGAVAAAIDGMADCADSGTPAARVASMAFDAARSLERSQPAFLKEVGASGP